MRFLLVNTNNAVRKIFNITAKKAAIQLDVVSAISQIPLKEDYNCIFIDDGVLGSGDVNNFRNKMMMTKFCIILSKDSPLVGGFDSYIRKPFLPTDIYEVMKKEKNSDLNTAPKSVQTPVINANSDIDLNEFSDSEDEFLSGPKETIDFDITPDLSINGAKNAESEIDLVLDSAPDSAKDEKSAQDAESSKIADDFEINFTLDSSELSKEGDSTNSANAEMLDIKATQEVDVADSKSADIPLDSTPKSAPKSVDVLEEAEAQINNIKALADKGGNFYNSSNDTHSIDFSAVMALQDELLKEEESKKKKRLIGGDISKKKEPTQAPKVAESSAKKAESSAKNAESSASVDKKADKIEKKASLEKDIELDSALDSAIDSAELKQELEQASVAEKKQDLKQDSAIDSADIFGDFELDSAEIENALDSAPIKENTAPLNDFDTSLADNIAHIDEQAHQTKEAQINESDFIGGLDGDLDALDSISSFSDIQSDAPVQPQATPKNATDILNNLDITNLNEDFETPTASNEDEFEGSKYNILGLPINDSGEIKDINDLSESELEKLDDEALLLLQERALQDKSPKVLDKQQIDAINDILEDTQGASDFGENSFGANNFGASDFSAQTGEFSAQASEFSMNNNEFQSLTQEALSEALDEGEIANFDTQDNQILGQDFGAQGFTKDFTAESSLTQDFGDFGDFQNTEVPIAESSAQNFANPTQNPQNQQHTQSTPTNQISINNNLDLAEIIKTFPIDKLRDLLSGVQITINITFPTKKQ